jgi:hypothetical protein
MSTWQDVVDKVIALAKTVSGVRDGVAAPIDAVGAAPYVFAYTSGFSTEPESISVPDGNGLFHPILSEENTLTLGIVVPEKDLVKDGPLLTGLARNVVNLLWKHPNLDGIVFVMTRIDGSLGPDDIGGQKVTAIKIKITYLMKEQL